MSIEVRVLEGPLGAASPLRVEGAGAVLCFEGVVRPDEQGEQIVALEYDVYRSMAEQSLRELSEETLRRFGLLSIFVEHSEGRVHVNTCSFRLRVAAPHRKEALQAMDWFIDKMKQDVPIWKRAVHAVQEGTVA